MGQDTFTGPDDRRPGQPGRQGASAVDKSRLNRKLRGRRLTRKIFAKAGAERPRLFLFETPSFLVAQVAALAVLLIAQIVAPDGYVAKLRARGYVVQEPDAGTE